AHHGHGHRGRSSHLRGHLGHVTRVAAYGSYAWRNWKQNHHWTTSGAPADPLGAGNTQLLSNLAVTPKAFYDVRKNITQASGAVSSLADVSGAGTYGPALVQATPANQPTWDGTTINFDGLASPNSDFLLSTSAIAGLDLSTQLTVALVLDLQAAGSAVVPLQIGAAANASPWMRLNGLVTTHILAVNTNSHGTPVSS